MEYAAAPIPAELAAWYRSKGYTSDVTIPGLMERNRDEFGACSAVIAGGVTLSWAELVDAASRFGGHLDSLGIGVGDVVVWQLPNWWESLIAAYGIWAVGAISSPVVPIYREFELVNVMSGVRPDAVIAASEFHDRNTRQMMDNAIAEVGLVDVVKIVVRGSAPGWTSFDDAMRSDPHPTPTIDVDAPALVGWTSGTTSGSKGVVHSTRGFLSMPARSTRAQGSCWRDRSYLSAPIAHAGGLLAAIATPLYVGSSVVLDENWDAAGAIDAILEHSVNVASGSAVFMHETLAALEAKGIERFELDTYTCGGSSIASELAQACEDKGMAPARAWGMTECPIVTAGTAKLHSAQVRTGTDGFVVPGCELRVVDDNGNEVGPGQAGEALVRGPQRALGYLDPEHTAEAFDEQGWFRTGDLGVVSAEGTFTVTGRKKEIINRGAEKLSSREIEDAIASHAEVAEAAVVAAPHPRLGEQPAAFVLVGGGGGASVETLVAHLHDMGLAPQKVPRIWRYVEEFPRTASGKVIKRELEKHFDGQENPAATVD